MCVCVCVCVCVWRGGRSSQVGSLNPVLTRVCLSGVSAGLLLVCGRGDVLSFLVDGGDEENGDPLLLDQSILHNKRTCN